ncbi:hypothetical protein H8K90_06180 [Winogradskyella echinorum]|uniref:Oxygen tolerance n=1 Tax=Winogradskyella echinorum TaxID=538189 RepID=A0ABR6XZQ0_9FLAO|nr:hypothetical protein [Winogradskyella echinorum]MBC3845957.1 hypothetical protein [Winogradskyella echinorum]MBC5750305.1 hypothetical protein [Winogradskyella echinorum]
MKSKKLNSVILVSKQRLGLSIIFFLLSLISFSQVKTEVDTTKIRIGEQINYKIKVEADSTALVVFPEGQTFMPLENVEALKIDTTKQEAKFLLSRIYKLTQFDSGSYTIPRQKVIIGEKPFFTDSLKVEVNSIEVDTTKQKLYDIKPIIEVEKSGGNWWKWLLGILAAIALVAFLLYWFIWRKKPLTEEEEIALLPPYDRAKLALKKLDESQYLIRSEVKDYYSELTFIIRKYLDEKVYDRALESTTDQLISRLFLLKEGNQIDLSKDTIKNLESILKRADLVKFAKSAPDTALAEMDKATIDKEIDRVKESLPEPTEEEKLLDKQYKEEQERKKKRKKVILTVAISVFLLIATFVGFGIKYGFGYVKDTIVGHESKELLEGDWVESAYGFPPIFIETPKVLKREEVELPDEAKGKMKIAMFSYGSLMERFYIITSTTNLNTPKNEDAEAVEEQKAININTVIEGNLKTWEAKGVKNIITKNEQFITPNAAEGLKTFGTAEFPGITEGSFEKGNYVFLSFTTENVIQQIVIVWRVDDVYAEEMVERIIDSVELKPDEAVEQEEQEQ